MDQSEPSAFPAGCKESNSNVAKCHFSFLWTNSHILRGTDSPALLFRIYSQILNFTLQQVPWFHVPIELKSTCKFRSAYISHSHRDDHPHLHEHPSPDCNSLGQTKRSNNSLATVHRHQTKWTAVKSSLPRGQNLVILSATPVNAHCLTVYSHCMGTRLGQVQGPNGNCNTMWKCSPCSKTGTVTRTHCFLLF